MFFTLECKSEISAKTTRVVSSHVIGFKTNGIGNYSLTEIHLFIPASTIYMICIHNKFFNECSRQVE